MFTLTQCLEMLEKQIIMAWSRDKRFVQFSLSCCSWQGAETGDAGEAVC